MALTPGTRVGLYEILSLLGAGGMGEVYRARDAKLNRDVALKIIPAAFASDAERLSRFRREAQLLAALNHPNIAHIYGVEETATAPALVLELVDGPTLANRIDAGTLDTAEALNIARQIALALEAAHAQGIIHRDLKPANVKVRDDGSVKVLDFGLAKALEAPGAVAADFSNSPTITNRATAVDIILGTAAYMAPEQAKGRPVDKRADIWAFGVVLFEMLSGRRLFHGDDVSETLAEVLKTDPDWNALPAATPSVVRRLLRRCLERDPNKRLHDIADGRLEIEDAISSPAAAPSGTPPGSRTRERWLWAAVVIVAAIAAATLARFARPPAVAAPETRLQIVTEPVGGAFASFSLSPDGRSIAYRVTAGARNKIWLRRLDSDRAHELPGTESVAFGAPVWSPDGRSILQIDGPTLKGVEIDSGTARPLSARVGGFGFGFSTNAEGTILFAPANAAPLSRMSMQGGTPEPATRVTPPQMGHRFPHFLPDGRRFLLLVTGPAGVQGIYLGTLGSLDVQRLVDADTAPAFLPPDIVVFGRQDSLFGQRVDLDKGVAIGAPMLIAESVAQFRTVFGTIAASAAANGTIAYRPAVFPPRRLTWRDRAGKPIGFVGDVDTVEGDYVTLSPDERTIAVMRRVNGNSDIWTIPNTPQGGWQRFTFDAAADMAPMWTPDSAAIAYQSARKGGGFYDLFRKPAGGDETALYESAENKSSNDWSRDDRFVLFTLQGREGIQRDIWALPLQGDRQPVAVTRAPADEIGARFSPDSRWVAYQSNADGPYDIYLRPFPGPGREWRISTNGGALPRWRGDGRELYYTDRNNNIVAVSLQLPSQGDALEHGAPVTLFRMTAGSVFTPSRDGQGFLINEVLEEVPIAPITIVLNWRPR